jgi:hypothetical protein
MIGGAVVVGGVAWWLWSNRSKLPTIPALPMKENLYPSQAERSTYVEPPASQTSTLPPTTLGSACPTISTPDEYNTAARTLGLPAFTGSLPTNAPDDPAVQTFNALVSDLKTKLGCFGPSNQDDTSTALPSDWANQSVSYK